MNNSSLKSATLIIVPALNESATIGEVIRSISEVGPQWDILVVNDGSVDGTGIYAALEPGVQVIDLCSNLGIGGAMQAGFNYALENGYTTAVQVDGDGQHDTSCIPRLLDAVSSGKADVAIGSRFLEGTMGSFQSTKLRRIGIRLLRMLCRMLSGYKILDVTSGFRALNRVALSLVARHYPSDFPEPESFVLFRRAKLKVREYPVSMRKRNCGISSISGLTSGYYMIKVLIALLIYSLRSQRDFNCRATANSLWDS
jgi:glycosyltransferase involved in cell wall biosynthesis